MLCAATALLLVGGGCGKAQPAAPARGAAPDAPAAEAPVDVDSVVDAILEAADEEAEALDQETADVSDLEAEDADIDSLSDLQYE